MFNKYKRHLPNIITTIRFILALSIPFLYLNGYILLSIIIFMVAAISDAIDGYLARKWNVVSNYGEIIDPFADKVLSIGVMVLIAIKINPLLYIPLFLELLIILLGVYGYKYNRKRNVVPIGKVKTFILFTAIAIALSTSVIPTLKIIIIPIIGITIIFQALTLKEYYGKLSKSKKNYRVIIEEDSSVIFVDSDNN